MKKLDMKKLDLITVLLFLFSVSCNQSDDVLIEVKAIPNLYITPLSGGVLTGSTALGVENSEAELNFLNTILNYEIGFIDESYVGVERVVITKSFRDQTVQVGEMDLTTATFSLDYYSVEEFIKGFDDLSKSDVRVGDLIVFDASIIMENGEIFSVEKGRLEVEVTCVPDLSGEYLMTSTFVNTPSDVAISLNEDDTWHLTIADGHFSKYSGICYNNYDNPGNIKISCNDVLPELDRVFTSDPWDELPGLRLRSGVWDANAATLTLQEFYIRDDGSLIEWTVRYEKKKH